jgi:hypothetical protein
MVISDNSANILSKPVHKASNCDCTSDLSSPAPLADVLSDFTATEGPDSLRIEDSERLFVEAGAVLKGMEENVVDILFELGGKAEGA